MAADERDNVFDPQELRRKAIERLKLRHGEVVDMPAADIATLVHELEVYQVELEVQNEELRRSQLELAEALERYQDLYDRAPVGYITLNDEGVILQVNHAAAALCFRDRDELEGRRMESLALAEDRDRLWLVEQRVLLTGLPQTCEFRIQRPSRDPRWARADISANRSRGYVQGFRLTLTDITARVQTEKTLEEQRAEAIALRDKAVEARRRTERVSAELRESEERFHTMADNISQLVWMADTSGGRFWYNRRWLDYTGTTVEEARGWGWTKVHHPDHVDRVVTGVRKAWDAGEPWEDTYPIRSKMGEYRWFLGRAVPIRNDAGEIVHWFGTNTDVTERERLLSEAQRLRKIAEAHDRAKDEFLALVSHELRTPLTAIFGYAQLMAAKPNDAAVNARAREIILSNAQMQRQLIDDLLDTARIISGKLRLTISQANLHLLMEDAAETVRPAAEAKRISLVTDLDEAPQRMFCDPTRLRQVLSNLLQNAIKFTPEGGRVELRAEQDIDQCVRLIVNDTGSGIAPDFLPVIFDRFSQVDMSSTRRHGGLGLGLALARHLVELHRGTITAASAGPGLGATFTVTLPLDDAHAASTQPLTPEHEILAPEILPLEELPRLDGLRILVVDDQPDGRQTMAEVLEERGALVTTAASGEDALQLLERSEFDALISDIAMPEMDGYGFIERLRARGQRLPAVALTALARPEDRVQALRAGFQAHVSKPVRSAELVLVLAGISDRHGR